MPLIDVGWRNSEAIAQPETEPCPTCGLGVTREPTVTVTRDGRTYHQTILRCPNSRKKRAPTGARFNKWTVCPVRKIETEIGCCEIGKPETFEKASEPKMANCHPSQKAKPAPKAWCDNIRQRLLAAEATQRQLANAAGLALSLVSKALGGRYDTTTLTMSKMNNALDVIEAGQTVGKHLGETAGENFIRESSEPQADADRITTQRLAAVEARLDAANDSLHNRQETAEYSLNQLAKSVERIDRDEAANCERIDNLREDLTAWAGIFDMLNGAIGKHKDQIALTRVVTEAHGERLTNLENSRAEWDEDHRKIGTVLDTCESRLTVLEAGGASLAEWGRNDSEAIARLNNRVGSLEDLVVGAIDNQNRHQSSIRLLTSRLDATIDKQDEQYQQLAALEDHQNGGESPLWITPAWEIRVNDTLMALELRLKALEGHPSGGESPLWDALDVLTTDVKELRSSYVNRPWAARIEETVEALAAEIRILHDYKRQDNSLMLAHADIVRRLNALELNNTDAFALRVIELLAGRLGS